MRKYLKKIARLLRIAARVLEFIYDLLEKDTK